jgi:hypothetical protein
VSGRKSARDYSACPGGLPHTTGGKASWATAWRPGPAAEAARDALRALVVRSPRAARVCADAVTHLTVVQWGLAGGMVLSASTGGVPGWRRAGGVEAGLDLAVARREGAEWRCRRRGGGRRQGSEGSGERRGGPVARVEAREVAAA